MKAPCRICGSGPWSGKFPLKGEMHCAPCKRWAHYQMCTLAEKLSTRGWLAAIGGAVHVEWIG
jgi:hypothetical protein